MKCYVCLFVCLSTKAVHLELVSDLTSDAFLATLRRFTSRRGKPDQIHSDCGTNYVGAYRELKRLMASLSSDERLQGYLAKENIIWKFNPPAAPHHGGLWKSTVKSMKSHIKKTVGEQILTYEEFLTLIAEVEACLNSRPLTPLSDDPADCEALTPGHFLIGTSLTSVPNSDISKEVITTLQGWKLMRRMIKEFWKRWSTDYLSTLQRRAKWLQVKGNLAVNELVLIKDDDLPPLKWKLGHVLETFPGADGKIRVVRLKTANGELKRPIVKLCPLPIIDFKH
ncbi:uncharacterized protein [Parasteatoda tepidariorum]|uniref:uncharacterized protein n=1 Tax=Parasteatoda tepidariorum TaxID=114398 RepID=UPI001C71DAF7|nr:uncharacterized protein LOC107457343 [Parasteatoda tepidariorum]